MEKEKERPESANPGAHEHLLTLDEAVLYALELLGNRQFIDAAVMLQRVLDQAPEHPDALNYLGIVSYQMGDRVSAIRLLRKAAAIAPNHSAIQNNLGNMLVDSGDVEGAVNAYKHAVHLEPDGTEAVTNLAAILVARHEYEDAEELLRHALSLDPTMGAAHLHLAKLLVKTGRKKDAVDHYWKATYYLPPEKVTPHVLALAYEWNGEREQAVAILEEWLENDPTNVEARHILAGFTGEATPERASDAFVERVFDRFANSFEAKLADLEYRAPELVGAAVHEFLGAPAAASVVLDAGCGTGLCGPHLRPYAKRLDGVDLSGGMLEKAAKLEIYDRLEKAELTAFLKGCEREYDLIASADTLCYFGPLETFARHARQALAPGGALIFTVEALPDDDRRDYVLGITGRYVHSAEYVERVMAAAGLMPVARESVQLRTENVEPVMGSLMTFRRER